MTLESNEYRYKMEFDRNLQGPTGPAAVVLIIDTITAVNMVIGIAIFIYQHFYLPMMGFSWQCNQAGRRTLLCYHGSSRGVWAGDQHLDK